MHGIHADFSAHPDEADIRAALSRVVASPGLNKSPQLANFLTFVVGETLAGRADRITAYNIASGALGRDENFDPQNDPIVRVEAGRLRRALEHYYANGGAGDPVIIELPRGHYVPTFRRKKAQEHTTPRLIELQRQVTDTLRDNGRLIVITVVIAVAVNFVLDLVWTALGIRM